jgi:cyclophilin family peptidyl-prolyl cis-trans isomerase
MAALAIVGILVFATGYYVLGRIPSGGGPTPTLPVAVLETSLGTIRIELDTINAPRTAANFIGLVRAGFYDGLTFHRVVADFVIQGGDPNGDGSGGSGTTVTWEDTGLRNTLHTIAMARSQSPDSATSQFFLNLKDNTNLDTPPAYVVFGRVIGGHEVVTSIGSVPTDANDKPLSSVTMTRVYMES